MHALINAAFDRSRVVLLALAFIFIAGAWAWVAIPKESAPDVPIPIVYVAMSHEGISPEDAERLLVRPMEKELQSIEGLKEMKSTASEGHASLILTFYAGRDIKRALDDVREKVDTAKAELPADTDEPTVQEINIALFPILTIALSGPLPERALVALARDLKDRIETINSLKFERVGTKIQVTAIAITNDSGSTETFSKVCAAVKNASNLALILVSDSHEARISAPFLHA